MRTLGLVAFLAIFAGSNVNAQNKSTTERIQEIFPSDQFDSKIEHLAFFERLLNERIVIEYVPSDDAEKFPLLSTVPLNNKYNSTLKSISEEDFNPTTFNPLAYQLPFYGSGTYVHVFRIDRTDYLLKILPQ